MAELKLKGLLSYHRISQAQIGSGVEVSPATINQIINRDKWPKTMPRAELQQRIINYLRKQGITDLQLVGIFETSDIERRQRIKPGRTIAKPTDNDNEPKEITPMLLRKQVLTQQARQLFCLIRDPFVDPQSSEELFISPEIRYVRENLYQVTRRGTFMAIVGESGSGKSTIRKDLHVRLANDSKDVIIIEPYIIGMEDNDRRGKTLKASDIATAIMESVAPGTPIPASSERRFSKVHQMLKESHRMGNRHVLIIEEAHSLPIATLKHLKRFYELEDGFEKLLSIVLIGQTELGQKLGEARADVREVVQRCEVVRLNPLDHQLGPYLKHRFALAGKNIDDIMSEDAIEALRHKLTGKSANGNHSYSVLYPLAIHNIVTAALNAAARVGAPFLSAEIIQEV